MNPLRLFHTVRYLRPEQIAAQVRHRWLQRFENPARHPAALAPAPEFVGLAHPPASGVPTPSASPNEAASLRAGEYTFINSTHRLGFPPEDWTAAPTKKLWFSPFRRYDDGLDSDRTRLRFRRVFTFLL